MRCCMRPGVLEQGPLRMIKRWSYRSIIPMLPSGSPVQIPGVRNIREFREWRAMTASICLRFTSRCHAPDSSARVPSFSSQREKPSPLMGRNPAHGLVIFPQHYFSREEVLFQEIWMSDSFFLLQSRPGNQFVIEILPLLRRNLPHSGINSTKTRRSCA